MYAVVYQFKFPSISEAKVAAGFCSESLGGKISEYDFLGLNILISKNGDLNINVKFEDTNSLKKFEMIQLNYLMTCEIVLFLRRLNLQVFMLIHSKKKLFQLKFS